MTHAGASNVEGGRSFRIFLFATVGSEFLRLGCRRTPSCMTHCAPFKRTSRSLPNERWSFERTTLHSVDSGRCGPPSIHAMLDALIISTTGPYTSSPTRCPVATAHDQHGALGGVYMLAVELHPLSVLVPSTANSSQSRCNDYYPQWCL